MKKSIRLIALAAVCGVMTVATHTSVAQIESTTTSTTTTAGTISEFSPDALVVKTETSASPMRYTYTKSTTYVDESGAPVSMDLVKSGLPVTVYYVKDGDNMVASKVIVRKAVTVAPATGTAIEKKTSTTTTIDK